VTAATAQEVDRFREAVAIQLPDSVVGVFLYGSVARGLAHEASDVDLLFAFLEEPLATDRNEVFEICSRFFGEHKKSINIESIPRLSSFVDSGDPFVWNVLATGVCVFSKPPIDVLLRRIATTDQFNSDAVSAFLRMKARVSLQLLLAAIEASRVHLHLAAMSLAQVEVLRTRAVISVGDILAVSNYGRLLQDCPRGLSRDALIASYAAHSDTGSADDPFGIASKLAHMLVAESFPGTT
jgi:predicted nucleotidyltransferase